MGKLLFTVLLVAALLGLVAYALRSLRRAMKTADAALSDKTMRDDGLQKLAFVILVAFIFYVSVSGGG